MFELSELLVDVLGVEDVGASFPHRVTYHPTCHSLRLLRRRRPAAAAAARTCAGIDLVELPEAEECCGFGGTFAVKNADTSTAMLADKLRHVLDTGAEVLHGGRHLVPDAHRRRRCAACGAGVARDAPRRDPGGARNDGRASRRRRAPRWPTRSCGATSARRRRRSAPSARGVVAELPDWEELREAGAGDQGAHDARTLDEHLERLEAAVTRAGGTVHWARDGGEANAIVADVARGHGAREVVKVKSMATDEIELNEALAEARASTPIETDLAELIVQLADDRPSHILVPAIHRNRAEIRDALRARRSAPDASRATSRAELAEAARAHLREKFLAAPVGVSGANFGVAETGHDRASSSPRATGACARRCPRCSSP